MTARGFTIVEMTMTLVIVGILANLALPSYSNVRRRADAARIVGDYNAIRLAAYDYYAGNNAYPRDGSWGRVPRQLAASLRQGFVFQYKSVSYRWRRWSLPNGMPRNRNQRQLLGLDVRTRDRALMRAIRSTFRGGVAFGTTTQITFVIE